MIITLVKTTIPRFAATKERFRPILIEWQRTSVLTTASGLYFMLWIPRAAPLHRALAPVSRGDWLAIWSSCFPGGHQLCFLQHQLFDKINSKIYHLLVEKKIDPSLSVCLACLSVRERNNKNCAKDGNFRRIFETISFFYLSFHPSRFHHSSLAYPLDLALAKFRLATRRRAWRRRDFNWKRVKPRARAHTSPHGERSRTGTRGKRKRDEPLDDDSCQ